LLGVGEGAILYQALAVLLSEAGGRGGRLQAGASDHHPCFMQGNYIGFESAPEGFVLHGIVTQGEFLGTHIEEKTVLHGWSFQARERILRSIPDGRDYPIRTVSG